MTESTRERFHGIAQFKRPNELFMMSMFSNLYWNGAIKRWRSEGAPDDIVPPADAVLYGPTLRQNSFFHFDRMEMMVDVHSGMGYWEDQQSSIHGYLRPITLVPIIPLFDPEVLAEDERTTTIKTAGGTVIKVVRAKDYAGGMPQYLERPVKDRASWESYKKRLDPNTSQRWPTDWDAYVQQCNSRDYPIGLYGGSFFGFLREWMGFEKLLFTFYDDPALIEDMMDHMLYFVTECAKRVLKDIKPDFVMIWEDMAYKGGSMISPAMFRKFMMPRYRKLADLFRSNGVELIIIDTDGNVNQLIPLWIECGINATWPLEVAAGNDAVAIRKEYGNNFIVTGNLDKRALAKGKEAIREELMSKVPFLLEKGGYFPSADHMIPPDVSWENYCYYIDTLREIGGLSRIFT